MIGELVERLLQVQLVLLKPNTVVMTCFELGPTIVQFSLELAVASTTTLQLGRTLLKLSFKLYTVFAALIELRFTLLKTVAGP